MAGNVTEKVLDEISAERDYQIDKWGNAFDDTHTPADWAAFATMYLGDALKGWKNNRGAFDWKKFRKNALKVATIMVAAVEAVDRNGLDA